MSAPKGAGSNAQVSGLRAAWGKRRYRVAVYVIYLIYLVACVLLLEGLSRLVPLGRRPPTFDEAFTNMHANVQLKKSPYLPFTLASAAEAAGSPGGFPYRTNALGYRGEAPTQLTKPDQVRRILLLGDSFTFGWAQLDDTLTFPALLSRKVLQVGPRWEVINAGYHAGYSPDAYYAFLAGSEGAELAPDLVVVSIFTGNDIIDMADNVWTRTDAHGTPTHVLTRRSYTDYRGHLLSDYSVPWYYRYPLLRNAVSFVWLSQVLSGPSSVPDGGTVDLAARFVGVMDGIARLSRERGFDLYVVAFDVPRIAEPPEGIRELVATTLRAKLDERHLRVLHGFYTEEQQIPGDGHWNEAGARAHAEQVFEMITPALRAHPGD